MTLIDAPEQLLGINETTGKSPETRIKDGASARALVNAVIAEDRPRAMERARVKGLIDGNPPYSDAKRKAAGLGWTANINLMEGKGMMDSSGIPYYSIFSAVEYYAETHTAYQPEHPEHNQWHQKIACRFHNMLKRWVPFDWHMQQASYQQRLHGTGPCFFDKKGDWRFRSVESQALKAPRKASSCVDKRIPFLVLLFPYTVTELYAAIRNEDSAGKVGWDVNCVKAAIIHSQKVGGAGTERDNDWEAVQTKLKNNDLSTSYTQYGEVNCAHLLVQEFSGKVSHFIVTESEIPEPGTEPVSDKKDLKFLFRDPNCYEGYEQALVVFFQSIGDGTWHNVRGLASDSFKHLEIINRLDCRTIDGAFIKSSLVLKSQNTKSTDKLNLMQIGPVTYLPAGIEIQQLALGGLTEEAMSVSRMVGNKLANNIGQFQQRSVAREDGKGEAVTAEQIRAQMSKEQSLGSGQMTQFYLPLDRLYAEMFRRAADPNTSDEEAKRFQEECIEDGVPKEALTKMDYVRANRAGGYGSPQMRQQANQQMLQSGAVAAMPPEGQNNFWRGYTGALTGPDKVDLFFPKKHIPNDDDSIAAIENAMFAMGRVPVLASNQDDVVHVSSHLEDAAKVLEPIGNAMEQGPVDPATLQTAFEYVNTLGPHVEAHLARMKADRNRKDLAKMFQDQLMHIVAFHGKLKTAIRTAQAEQQLQAEQQQQATVLGALDQAKVDSMRTEMQLKAEKVQNDIRLKAMKESSNMRLKQLTAAEQIRLQRAKDEPPEPTAA